MGLPMMKFSVWTCTVLWGILLLAGNGWGQNAAPPDDSPPAAVSSPSLEEILQRVEARYSVPGFTARFSQTSLLKAMDITDTASGRIAISRPGKMRWEYEAPETQVIISDGVQLWIYRPDDNQVMIGKAPAFFGDGKGASFLSDIGKMRNNFDISLEDRPDADNHILTLVPRKKTGDLTRITLSVSWATFGIEEIVTVNDYGDETRIVISEETFDPPPGDGLFEFAVPDGVEILQLDE